MWLAPEATSQSATPTAVTPKVTHPAEVRALSRSFSAVARAIQPSVVRLDIETEKPRVARFHGRPMPQAPPDLERFFDRFFGDEGFPMPGPGRGTGSGLVLDAAGNILTNSHVVENAAKVTVTLSDGRELAARVVGRDPRTDVAIVRLEQVPAGLVAARLGDSGKAEVGEWVLAVGSPLGLDQSVTAGIISGKGKVGRNVHMGSAERVREYIQTDAKINPGNSGGPLVNLEGEVIGINTLINVGPGGAYGFAIPINHAHRVSQTIITNGRVKHAYLGVRVADVKDGVKMTREGGGALVDMPKEESLPKRAAWVADVLPGGPAHTAGIHAGDVITQIDGKTIESKDDVLDYVSARPVGAKVTVAYLRDGKPATAQVTLGELQSDLGAGWEGGQARQDKIGCSLQTLTPELARGLGVDPSTKGAVVSEVVADSRAAKAGLREGDVILEVNRKPVASADDAIATLKQESKRGILLRIRRAGGAAQFVSIPPP